MCLQGREANNNNFLFANIDPIYPITLKLNQDVSSFSAYLRYSPGIMCMPKDIERKGNPKRFKQPYGDL